jgi:hypothetical protein
MADGLQIITNNAPRPLLDWVELTDAERAAVDWADPEAGESFFRYRGSVYAVSEFLRASGEIERRGWHGFAADSYFSGVAIRLPEGDPDSIICGRVFA